MTDNATPRIRYWLNFARGEHRRELELLLREAKLGRKPRCISGQWTGWNNVVKHQVAEAAATRVLCRALQLSQYDTRRLETFAFVHDATKHLDVFLRKTGQGHDWTDEPASEQFSTVEEDALRRKYAEICDEVDPDGVLRIATSEEFFRQLFATTGDTLVQKIEATDWCQVIQYYVDAIFLDDRLVSPLERITETEKRSNLNDDPEWTRLLGMKYWDAERLVSIEAQRAIWRSLSAKGNEIPSAENVPEFIRRAIDRDISEYLSRLQETAEFNTASQ